MRALAKKYLNTFFKFRLYYDCFETFYGDNCMDVQQVKIEAYNPTRSGSHI